MYRIFSLGFSGRLYQLGSRGWVATDGTSFKELHLVRRFLSGRFVPPLPDGSTMADSYIASVDCNGNIVSTYSYFEELV